MENGGMFTRDDMARAWLEGYLVATGLDRGYSSQPGAYAYIHDDEQVARWNPYVGSGYEEDNED